MENSQLMQKFETSNNTDDYAPYLLFWKPTIRLLVLSDLLEQVTIVSKVHHNAQKFLFLKKSLFVSYDAWVVGERSQDTNLIQSILSFFNGEWLKGYFLESVDFIIRLSLHFVDLTEWALPKLFYDSEVCQRHPFQRNIN